MFTKSPGTAFYPHVCPALDENLSLRFITSLLCVTRVSLAFRTCLCTKNEAPERGRPGDMKGKRPSAGYKIPCKRTLGMSLTWGHQIGTWNMLKQSYENKRGLCWFKNVKTSWMMIKIGQITKLSLKVPHLRVVSWHVLSFVFRG